MVDWNKLSCGVTTFGEISSLNTSIKMTFMLFMLMTVQAYSRSADPVLAVAWESRASLALRAGNLPHAFCALSSLPIPFLLAPRSSGLIPSWSWSIAHATEVTKVSGGLDALTEVQPIVVGTVLSNPFGIVFGLPDCSECLLRRLPLVADECHFFDLYCWFHIGDTGFKLAWIPPFSLSLLPKVSMGEF